VQKLFRLKDNISAVSVGRSDRVANAIK